MEVDEEDSPLEDRTVKELKEECKTIGVSNKGKKTQLYNNFQGKLIRLKLGCSRSFNWLKKRTTRIQQMFDLNIKNIKPLKLNLLQMLTEMLDIKIH